MKIKNSLGKENDSIDSIRKSNGKSVDKKNKKSVENNLEYANNKYLDDTNIKIKNNYYCLLNDLDNSTEKEETTSKDSKDNTLSENSFSVSSQVSLSMLPLYTCYQLAMLRMLLKYYPYHLLTHIY